MLFLGNRNDPCWCGSGEKYKRCHIDHDEKLDGFKRDGYPIPRHQLIRSQEQIDGIRKASQLTKEILDKLNDIIEPGITTNHIDAFVYEYTIQKGAIPAPLNYKGFPKSICTSLNEVICHGIPDDTVLKDGDILNVDVTSILDGYYGDSCRMYTIGTISEEAQQLIDVTKQALQVGIEAVKPFESVANIGNAIEAFVKPYGYGIVDMFGGHGIGDTFHDDPFVCHSSRKHKQMILVPGMTFTIEPMLNLGTKDAEILDDDWTAVTKDRKLSAQWEHTVLVTEDGAVPLTA